MELSKSFTNDDNSNFEDLNDSLMKILNFTDDEDEVEKENFVEELADEVKKEDNKIFTEEFKNKYSLKSSNAETEFSSFNWKHNLIKNQSGSINQTLTSNLSGNNSSYFMNPNGYLPRQVNINPLSMPTNTYINPYVQNNYNNYNFYSLQNQQNQSYVDRNYLKENQSSNQSLYFIPKQPQLNSNIYSQTQGAFQINNSNNKGILKPQTFDTTSLSKNKREKRISFAVEPIVSFKNTQNLNRNNRNSKNSSSSSQQLNYDSLNINEIVKLLPIMVKEQLGCRFLQNKMMLDTFFAEKIIIPNINEYLLEVINNQFGNYLIQKILEVVSKEPFSYLFNYVSIKIHIIIDK